MSVKFFVTDDSSSDQEPFIAIFHRWIRESRLGDELLIDVADYRHVHHGPGVMLIAQEGHYAMDRAAGRLGLRYSRKRDAIGEAGPRLEEALRRALTACCALEEDYGAVRGRLRFRGDRLRVDVVSRLVAPNTEETLAGLRPALDALLARVFPDTDLEVARRDAPAAPFGVEVLAPANASVQSLLSRLG